MIEKEKKAAKEIAAFPYVMSTADRLQMRTLNSQIYIEDRQFTVA